MKARRQAEILRIITTNDVETQEQLLEELESRGLRSTQATISRDIKNLHLIKELSGTGAYRYTVSERNTSINNANRLQTIFRESVASVDVAMNIVVFKTMPGLGSAAGAALDSMDIEDMVGSLAGDDTVIVIMRTTQGAGVLCQEIQQMLDKV